ncbi:MAG: hypothetical protein ACLRNP_14670, partial [Blautia coccoides]
MYPESAKNIATENEERKECDECKNSTGEQHLRAATMAAGLNMGVATFVTNAMLPRRRNLWEISQYWSVKALLQSFFWAMFCHII